MKAQLNPENFKKTVLPNGIKVISEHIPHVQSFSLGFCFNVGSRDESRKNNGITHFIEHMLFKGTKTRSARKIAEEIESYGGYLNAFTSKEHTCYYGRGLSRHLPRTFNVIADMIQNPSFKTNEIKKEAGVVIDELNDINDNPEELIFDKFEEVVFSGNPLGFPIIGTEKNILSFGQQDLFDFINEKYGFNNLTIAASGQISHEQILYLTDKYFIKNLGRKNHRRKFVTPQPAPHQFIDKNIQQVHIIIGRASYGYKDKKRMALNVLSHILGEGSSSRLFQVVRERNGIAYQLNTFLNSFYDISSFGVYLSTNEKQAGKALGLIHNEFEKIRSKIVSDKELKKAKEYIKGNMLLGLENTTSRMFNLANSEFYYGRFITPDELIQMIENVTSEDILNIASEVLDENKLTRVIISPNASLLQSAA
jgi:predicted Zn-dependent peptidase